MFIFIKELVNIIFVAIDEKGHTDRDPVFEKKRQVALAKKLGCKFIRFNTNKENYNADYEIGRILTFILELKNKELKRRKSFLKERIAKELLDYMSSISKPLKHVKYFIKKILPLNIKNDW